MKRYNFGTRDIYRHDTGDWVMYDDVAEQTRKLDALRNEVKAWRDADDSREEERLPWSKAQAICKAMDVTDTLNALEDER